MIVLKGNTNLPHVFSAIHTSGGFSRVSHGRNKHVKREKQQRHKKQKSHYDAPQPFGPTAFAFFILFVE
jgi:hypothetical protein